MPDRENIIRRLERMKEDAYVSAVFSDVIDDALALLKEQDKENEKHQAILEQYDMALALLKCLEPVRPVRKKEIGAYHSLYYMCGNCGAWLLDGQKFCDECGRKVKWDE